MVQKFRFLLLCACSAALIGCATPAPIKTHVVLSDDGLSEIAVPDYWRTRPNLGRNADIRLADAVHDSYLLVNSYLPGNLKPMSFEQFAERMSGALRDNLTGGKMSAARRFTIGERPAIEHEVSGATGDTRIVYLSTVVDGRQARYHLIGWALAEQYRSNRADLQRVQSAFRESDTRRVAKKRQSLDFKWPATMTSRTSFHDRRSKRGETFEIQGEAVSTVKPAGKDELLISSRVTSQKMTANGKRDGQDTRKDAYLQNVLKAAMTDMPDYVVNTDGEFVRIDNLAAYHKRIQDAVIKGLPRGEPTANAKAQQLVEALLTKESLAVLMQDEWNNMAGNWAGGSYAVGEQYEFAVPYQAPALGNRAFPMLMTQQLAGFVPCQAGTVAKSCVRLVQSSRVASPEFTEATNELVRKTVGREVTVSDTEVINTFEVVTDPKTLLPYSTHKKQVKRVTVSVAGKERTSEDVEESSATYRY